jgi:hypothetical protein
MSEPNVDQEKTIALLEKTIELIRGTTDSVPHFCFVVVETDIGVTSNMPADMVGELLRNLFQHFPALFHATMMAMVASGAVQLDGVYDAPEGLQ